MKMVLVLVNYNNPNYYLYFLIDTNYWNKKNLLLTIILVGTLNICVYTNRSCVWKSWLVFSLINPCTQSQKEKLKMNEASEMKGRHIRDARGCD